MRIFSLRSWSTLSRFFRFLKRFVPLVIPLLLIWIFPGTREIAHLNAVGTRTNRDPATDAYGVVAFAQQHPDDLGAAIDVALTGDFDQASDGSLLPLNQRLDGLPQRFPREAWLPAFCALYSPLFQGNNGSPQWMPGHSLGPAPLKLREALERGGKREPDNAFWIVALAQWEWMFAPRSMILPQQSQLPNYGPLRTSLGPPELIPDNVPILRRVVALLREADRCTRYNDGNWEGQRALKNARRQRRGASLEEQVQELDFSSYNESGTTDFALSFDALGWLNSQYGRNKNGKVHYQLSPVVEPLTIKRRMELGLTIAHIGLLIDETKQVYRLGIAGYIRPAESWLSTGWSLDAVPSPGTLPPGYDSSGLLPPNADAEQFIARARQHGFFNIATRAQHIASPTNAHDVLIDAIALHNFDVVGGTGSRDTFAASDALLPRFAFQGAGLCLNLYYGALCLAAVWIALNIYLLRGKGAPSPRPARWWPATLVTLAVVAGGLGLEAVLPGEYFVVEGPCGAVIVCILLALWCSTLTVRRHRQALQEAAFDKWNTSLVPPRFAVWLAPIGLWLGVGIIAFGLLLTWATSLFLFGSLRAIPVLLPFDGIVHVNTIVTCVVLYGMGSLGVALIFWLGSWRFAWKSARPLMHGGLRWWKETIGASICVLAWVYLLLALLVWPLRLQAKRLLEERWQKGDWVFLQERL